MRPRLLRPIAAHETVTYGEPVRTMVMYHAKRILAWFVPDWLYVKLAFFKSHGWLPRTPPVTFNEYLCDLKSTGELAEFQRFADKCAVREHVARKVQAKYLVPLHGTAERLTREAWDNLPESFVLKTNHGSSWFRIVRNKSDEDYSSVAAETDGWLRKNFYYVRRESQYKEIKPILMFEELLTEKEGNNIRDYKFFCLHGKVHFIRTTCFGENQCNDYYDKNWNRLDITRDSGRGDITPRPETLDEMIEVAQTLAEDFIFVRVDLYSARHHVYFSELTFVPGGGSGRFLSTEFEECAGRLWAGEDMDLTRFHCRRKCP